MAGGTGHVPLFVPVAAPQLKRFDPPSIAKFRRERKAYERRIDESRGPRGGGGQQLLSIKSCIEETALKGRAKYVLKINVEDITDEILNTHFDAILRDAASSSAPDLENKLKRRIKMDMTIKDPAERVFEFLAKGDETIEELGLTTVFNTADGIKQKLKIFRAGVRPPMLQNIIERSVKLQHRDARTDELKFFELLQQEAINTNKVEIAAAEVAKEAVRDKNPNNRQGKSTKKLPEKEKMETEKVEPEKAPKTHVTRAGRSIPIKTLNLYSRKDPPEGGCLVCKKEHWVQVCETATEEQVKTAFEHLSAKKSTSIKRMSIPTSSPAKPLTNHVRIEGTMEFPI